ncbi:recombinase family protein [Streptomyces lydicus]|uniref:recombinase family protein n=1 Tax=Streptomyces lydicus TaxID=47763 RepID=UPI0037A5905A
MDREDLPTLRALGFSDHDLQELGLWDVAQDEPARLAEAYIRRSKKQDSLTTLRGHVKDIARCAQRDGVTIRHVWFEQKSASKAHVRREEFEKATKSVLEGLSLTLYVWKTDRLSRRGMGAVGRLLDDLDKRRARLVSVTEGLDSSRGGRIVFAILSERARDEAKDIALRVKAGSDAHKGEGRWPGGVVPYGLEAVLGTGKLRRRASEYPTARTRIAEPLLEGTSARVVADTLNAAGITTRSGKKWRGPNIVALVHSPLWAGLVPNRERATDEFGQPLDTYARGGQPLMGPDGKPVSCGEGVITYAERERILGLFRDRSRMDSRGTGSRRGKRESGALLTGEMRCPHCAGLMTNGGSNYRCLARMTQGTSVCKGTTIRRDHADFAMSQKWITHVSALEPDSPVLFEIARRWLSYQDAESEAKKRDLTTALDDALSREKRLNEAFYVAGTLEETQFDELSRQLRAQKETINAELKTLDVHSDLTPLLDAELLAEAWDAATVTDKRMLIRAAVRRIVVATVPHQGAHVPAHDRLQVDWRDGSSVK